MGNASEPGYKDGLDVVEQRGKNLSLCYVFIGC